MLGGGVGLWAFSVRHKISLLKLADVSTIGLTLGQAIGRWGNFFNSEAYGLPTSLPWKLYIAPEHRQVPFLNEEFYHPAFLYESLLDLFIFVFLIYLIKAQKLKFNGQLSLIYLILYSLARIFVETIRIDSAAYVFGVPVAIFVSVGIIIVSLILLNILKNKELK